MNEYINKAKLYEEITILERFARDMFLYTSINDLNHEIYKERWHERKALKHLIVNFESEDVEPVKHGTWKWNPNSLDWNIGAWECSECKCRNNNLPTYNPKNPFLFKGSNYCPNCGAKMDKNEVIE